MKIFTSNNFIQFFLLNCPQQTTCIFKTTTHNITTKIKTVQHSGNPNCKRNMNQNTTITTKQQNRLLNQTKTIAIITYTKHKNKRKIVFLIFAYICLIFAYQFFGITNTKIKYQTTAIFLSSSPSKGELSYFHNKRTIIFLIRTAIQ